MEILAEIVITVLSWILQFLGELVLQILIELFGEVIGHGIREVFGKPEPMNPWLAAFGYACLGAIGGGISLLVFPELFIQARWLRAANLVLSPVAAGLVMAGLGAWRRRHEREVIRLESFAYGFLFAFAVAAVRGWWGH